METIKKTVKVALALILFASAVFAQSTLVDAKKAFDAEQYQKAKDILKKLIAAKPTDGENYFYLGNVYLKNDHIDSAKATYTSGVTAAADFALNYVGLGSVDLESANTSAAKANFDKAVGLAKKKDDAVLLYIGKAYIGAPKPDYDQALVYLDKALAINPKDAEVLLAKGDAFYGRKGNNGADLSTAFSNYNDAITLDPNLLRAQLQLSVIDKQTRAWKEATDGFAKILAKNPNYGPAYRELAETEYNWGRVETKDYDMHMKNALTDYEKYLDLTDRSLESRLRHADFLVNTKSWKELEKEAQAMSTVAGTNPRVFRYLAFAAFNNGNYAESEKAESEWLEKIKGEPGRAITQDYLVRGRARLRIGKVPEGLDDMSSALKLDSTASDLLKIGVIDSVSVEAKKFYDAKDYPNAIKAYTLALRNPNLSKKLGDTYSLGLSNYYYYTTKYQKDTVNYAQGYPYLVAADSAFSTVLRSATKGSPTEEILLGLKANAAIYKDDPKKNEGTFIPALENYIAIIGAKPTISANEKTRIIGFLGKIGYYYYNKADAKLTPADPLFAKAKEYYTKVLALDPTNDYAQKITAAIDMQVEAINNPPAAKPKAGAAPAAGAKPAAAPAKPKQ